MATQAAQVVVAVRRPRKVHMIFPGPVALQTALIYFFCRRSFEAEDLLGITFDDMGGARPVTSLASLFGRTATLVECGFPVRGFVKVLVNFFVAVFAGLTADVISGAVGCWFGLARFDGLRRTARSEPHESNSQRTANEQSLDDSVWTQPLASKSDG